MKGEGVREAGAIPEPIPAIMSFLEPYVSTNIIIFYVIKNLFFRNLMRIFAVLFGPKKGQKQDNLFINN